MSDSPASDGDENGRRWHDMGGWFEKLDQGRLGQGKAAIDRSQHDFELWEKRVDALMVLASSKGLMTVDGLRRALEDMGEQAFDTMSYYERWIASIAQNLVEAGVFTADELRERMEAARERGALYGEAARSDRDA